MFNDKEHLREELVRELMKNRIFWSYMEPDKNSISDNVLIEKILIHLDMDDINKLLLLFPKKKVKQVWDSKLVPDIRHRSMNLLFAYLFFNIKNPDKYLERKQNQHYQKLAAS